jgi:Flp pilus assembly protein TadB
MKNVFSSGRRKFFGLLAGAAALPLTAMKKRVADETPEPVKNQAFVITASGKVGIGVNNPSCELHIQYPSLQVVPVA